MGESNRKDSTVKTFWIIAAEVMFHKLESTDPETNEDLWSLQKAKVNVLYHTETNHLNQKSLVQIQQMAQMRFFDMPDPKENPSAYKVFDVFTVGISNIGRMTSAQFEAGFEDANKAVADKVGTPAKAELPASLADVIANGPTI